jgi:plastocyanin
MKRHLILCGLLLLGLAGCSSNNKVGSGVDLNVKNAAGQGAIRGSTTTAAPAATTVPAGSGALGKTTTTPAPTTAPPTTAPPTTVQQTALEIAVNGDSSGVSQFDPSQARVYAGSIVKWTNKDSQPRSIEADQGEFASPKLNPGESFTYKANSAGKFNYHDGTRPYAVASLEVLAR